MVTGLAAGLVIGLFMFIGEFTPDSPVWDAAVLATVITLIVTLLSVSVGGLITTMSTVAQDPAPPNVPLDAHMKALDKLE